MKVGLLTGGGDAPGLNGIIEAVTRTLLRQGAEVIGICDGFEGVFENRVMRLRDEDMTGLHSQAGTFLGTSNRCGTEGREEEFLRQLKTLNLDALIAAGGDGTFRGLAFCQNQLPLIGVPKTIDNDISGTEFSFGYDTACSVVSQAVDELRATANAHRRVIFVETMGRTAGWIALGGGLASCADAILIPERPFAKSELLEHLKGKYKTQRGVIAVVSEGAYAQGEDPTVAFEVKGAPQQERFGGIAHKLAVWVEQSLGCEGRHVVLGHLQRSKPPTTTDRFLTLAMGTKAAELALKQQGGKAVVFRGGRVTEAPLEDLIGAARLVGTDHHWVKTAKNLGLFI